MLTDWLKRSIDGFARSMPPDFWLEPSYVVKALLTIILVSLICGSIGSLVVGNRMAFFSDALAHCAFAGVTLGMLVSLTSGQEALAPWLVPFVMVSFGVLIGLAVVYVRENTTLASDTVIAVFYAFAVGFGVMLVATLNRRTFISPEGFLFGSAYAVYEFEIIVLFLLACGLAIALMASYNSIVLAIFNPSLARSRGVRVRFWNYAFVIVLALIVNLCLKAVGVLLINALLVIPAATAANLGRGARSMFWWAVGVSSVSGVLGLWLSHRIEIPLPHGERIPLAPSGTIVLLCVTAFFGSLVVRMVRDRRTSCPHTSVPTVA